MIQSGTTLALATPEEKMPGAMTSYDTRYRDSSAAQATSDGDSGAMELNRPGIATILGAGIMALWFSL